MQKPVRYHITEFDDRPVVRAFEVTLPEDHAAPVQIDQATADLPKRSEAQSGPLPSRRFRPARLPAIRLHKS